MISQLASQPRQRISLLQFIAFTDIRATLHGPDSQSGPRIINARMHVTFSPGEGRQNETKRVE